MTSGYNPTWMFKSRMMGGELGDSVYYFSTKVSKAEVKLTRELQVWSKQKQTKRFITFTWGNCALSP